MFVVLLNVPLITLAFPDCVTPPVNPVPVGAVQLYVVPVGTIPLLTSVGVIVNSKPLHTVVLSGLIIALGLKLTVNENTDPTQLPEVGVTK
jgi:hypothetical protein